MKKTVTRPTIIRSTCTNYKADFTNFHESPLSSCSEISVRQHLFIFNNMQIGPKNCPPLPNPRKSSVAVDGYGRRRHSVLDTAGTDDHPGLSDLGFQG